jgi:hypothetical protein
MQKHTPLGILPSGLLAIIVLSGSTGCSPSAPAGPAPIANGTPAVENACSTPTPSSTSTPAPSATPTATPTATPKWPLTIVFYGDSLLRVGEVGREAKWSFSFVDDLREKLDPEYNLITANYGGRNAAWAAENIETAVLSYDPDSVTLWWGFNDLLGCGGFFDLKTNKLLPDNLDNLSRRHLQGIRTQVDRLLEKGNSVLIVTSIPVDGKLPWTHFDQNGRLVWEWDHLCDYNIGLERLAEGQRALAEEYAAAGKPVYAVDVWQRFLDGRKKDGMYMDLMHPGPIGADLIAAEWLRVFGGTGAVVRPK